jgi:hypothetical protein
MVNFTNTLNLSTHNEMDPYNFNLKSNNYSFSLFIMYGISYMFRHYIAILRVRCVSRNNTPIHNILSTAPQLSISQKALGSLPEDGNVMPKHVGDTIHY